MNCCTWRAPMVTLVTGEQVPSDSPKWLHECQARYIIELPTRERREKFLAEIAKRNGEEAKRELVKTIRQLWEHSLR